ncbi:MAG: Rrf2 family transcriptional regulator [Bacteroidota bacterium]
MKVNKQDEHGLRILLQIARHDSDTGLSIPQLSKLESISAAYVAKLTRKLRLCGIIESTRGQKGGYILSKSPADVSVKSVIDALGGTTFVKNEQLDIMQDDMTFCTNSVDCSMRSLWKMVQITMDKVLEDISLQDLIGKDQTTTNSLAQIAQQVLKVETSPSNLALVS